MAPFLCHNCLPAFAGVSAFLVVIPPGSASSFAVAVGPATGPGFSPDIPPLSQTGVLAPGTLSRELA